MTNVKNLRGEYRNALAILRHYSIHPKEPVEIEGLDIAGASLPKNGFLGGDSVNLFDFKKQYDLEKMIEHAKARPKENRLGHLQNLERRVGIFITDVAGHQLSDQIVGHIVHHTFLGKVKADLERYGHITPSLFAELNDQFSKVPHEKTVSALYGEVTVHGDNAVGRFISAGHPFPYVFRASTGKFDSNPRDKWKSSMLVGLAPYAKPKVIPPQNEEEFVQEGITVNDFQLSQGDFVLFYTDGLSDHRKFDTTGRKIAGGRATYFPQHAESILREVKMQPAKEIIDRIMEDVKAPGYYQSDDVTAYVIKKT